MGVTLAADVAKAPFMGESLRLSVGLNPLGLRTPSEQLFTALLPGMNVVTLRIRYYSFYCWLLSRYYEGRDEATVASFRRHIRMSELLMALIQERVGHGTGVPGITYAREMNEDDGGMFDLASGAMPDGHPSGGYWKGSYGAFGTYYAASLVEMGLIAPLADNHKLYAVTDDDSFISGRVLADAFANSVGEECAVLFMSLVERGTVSHVELSRLSVTFRVRRLPDNAEAGLLTDMLLQPDTPWAGSPTFMRRESLRLMLEYLDSDEGDGSFDELGFATYVYRRVKNGYENGLAATGWYAYWLNDNRQYHALVIFSELLARLRVSREPGRWENIATLSSAIADEVCEEFGLGDVTMSQLFARWRALPEPDGATARAFRDMFAAYVDNPAYHDHRDLLRETFGVLRNDAIHAFDRVGQQCDMTLHRYVEEFITETAIYGHYAEAMRKYSQNGVATQKLTIENGCVRGLELYEPSHSSPRANTLYNFVCDLGLAHGRRLTPQGRNLKKRLSND